jgi:hypothetical protein
MPCHSFHVQLVAVDAEVGSAESLNSIRSPTNHAYCGRDDPDER